MEIPDKIYKLAMLELICDKLKINIADIRIKAYEICRK